MCLLYSMKVMLQGTVTICSRVTGSSRAAMYMMVVNVPEGAWSVRHGTNLSEQVSKR